MTNGILLYCDLHYGTLCFPRVKESETPLNTKGWEMTTAEKAQLRDTRNDNLTAWHQRIRPKGIEDIDIVY